MSRFEKNCTIDGCQSRVWSREMCRKHYARWHQHGDPLKTLIAQSRAGAPAAFIAIIPENGTGCVIWPFSRNNYGYAQINDARTGKILVSRIMCERQNGAAPSNKHQAAHSCGNGHAGCIAPWHLSWKTARENNADMDQHGTRSFGEKHATKLTFDDVTAIRAMSGSYPQTTIGQAFGVSQSLVSRILRGTVWRRSA